MTLELDQPIVANTPDAAISALLCLFHHYAMSEGQSGSSPRLSQRIYQHLEGLSQRDDLPEILHRTCDELSDAWVLMAERQLSQCQAVRP